MLVNKSGTQYFKSGETFLRTSALPFGRCEDDPLKVTDPEYIKHPSPIPPSWCLNLGHKHCCINLRFRLPRHLLIALKGAGCSLVRRALSHFVSWMQMLFQLMKVCKKKKITLQDLKCGTEIIFFGTRTQQLGSNEKCYKQKYICNQNP